MDVLWLSSDEIKKIIDISELIPVVEKAFEQHGLGRTQMPSKSYLSFDKYNGDLRTMPAYVEDLEMAGVKIVNSHPNNPSKGIPTVMAVMILNDPKTGAPLAIMDGTYLTDMRTGAAGAVAVKHLARKNSKIIGLVGAGRQARTQLQAISNVVELEKAIVVDKSLGESKKFKEEMESIVGIDIEINENIKSVCDSDILVTTTPVRSPIVMEEWISDGVHINAMGADAEGKEELEPGILKKAKIVIDDISQAVHSGEINVPLSKGVISEDEIYANLGEIVAFKIPGRTSDDDITIFDSTGLAIQDIAAGKLVYEMALESGMGQRLRLF